MNKYMYSFYKYKTWIVYCSFVVAILLQFMFLSLIRWYICPSLVMIILIYWTVIFPKKINIGTGFVLGFIMDCIFGSILGIQTLSFSIISYITIRKHCFFRYASVLQQCFFISFSSLANQIMKLLIKFLITQIVYYSPEIFWTILLDGMVWPFFMILMRKIYRF